MTASTLYNILGGVCLLTAIVARRPKGVLRMTLGQIYGEARKGNLRSSLPINVLTLLGIGLVFRASWLSWHGR